MQSCIPTMIWWWCGGSATSNLDEVLGLTPQTWLNGLALSHVSPLTLSGAPKILLYCMEYRRPTTVPSLTGFLQKYYALSTIVVKDFKLDFRCWCYPKFQYVCTNVKHPIEAYGFIVFGHPSHEKMSLCHTHFGFQKVRCIQMYVHYHVWSMKMNFNICALI